MKKINTHFFLLAICATAIFANEVSNNRNEREVQLHAASLGCFYSSDQQVEDVLPECFDH